MRALGVPLRSYFKQGNPKQVKIGVVSGFDKCIFLVAIGALRPCEQSLISV